MAQVTLKNVTKTFTGGIQALNHVSLNIADGELMVVVGPSGCGKTTLLRLIAGLESTDTGSISIGGLIVNNVPPKDRGVAMVFQNYALYPHLTAFENLAFGLRFRKHSKSEIKKRVEGVATTLGITDLLSRRPSALSGGQRQRVALGRAMAQQPKLFLFDEPLSNLDPQSRVSSRRELKSLHQRLKTTTVYVTHDQSEAMTLGDRLAVMCDGVIRQVGLPLEVFNTPADRFVASFIGTPQMNFFEGIVRINGNRAIFETYDGQITLPEQLAKQVKIADEQELTIGIRPRDLCFEPVSGSDKTHLLGQVNAIENTGDNFNVYIKTRSGREFTASSNACFRSKVGDLGKLRVDPQGIKIFRRGPFGSNIAFDNSIGG